MFDKVKKFAVVTGMGKSDISALNAIDNAMLDAGIGNYNLITVSSILPKEIKKVNKIDQNFGAFIPCVLAEAVGIKNKLAAGLAYGFDNEGGGYIAENSLCDKEINPNKFRRSTIEKVKYMGENRNKKLKNIQTCQIIMDVGNKKYGCAIAALVYLK